MYSGLHNASNANCAGSSTALRSADCVRELHSATPNQSALFATRESFGIKALWDQNKVAIIRGVGYPKPGRTLRVKGRGITKGSHVGDLLVTVDVQVPQRVDGKALEALKSFAEATAGEDVRAELAAKAKQ